MRDPIHYIAFSDESLQEVRRALDMAVTQTQENELQQSGFIRARSELAAYLRHLNELSRERLIRCPGCGELNLQTVARTDQETKEHSTVKECAACGWWG